jgi:uncharacterized protein
MWLKAILLGIVAGFASGLLGIGGGVIVVPGLVLILSNGSVRRHGDVIGHHRHVSRCRARRVRDKGFRRLGHQRSMILAGSGIGAWVGAHYLERVPEHLLAGIFSVVMIISSIRMAL